MSVLHDIHDSFEVRKRDARRAIFRQWERKQLGYPTTIDGVFSVFYDKAAY